MVEIGDAETTDKEDIISYYGSIETKSQSMVYYQRHEREISTMTKGTEESQFFGEFPLPFSKLW